MRNPEGCRSVVCDPEPVQIAACSFAAAVEKALPPKLFPEIARICEWEYPAGLRSSKFPEAPCHMSAWYSLPVAVPLPYPTTVPFDIAKACEKLSPAEGSSVTVYCASDTPTVAVHNAATVNGVVNLFAINGLATFTQISSSGWTLSQERYVQSQKGQARGGSEKPNGVDASLHAPRVGRSRESERRPSIMPPPVLRWRRSSFPAQANCRDLEALNGLSLR